MQTLRWMRILDGTVFAVGAIVLVALVFAPRKAGRKRRRAGGGSGSKAVIERGPAEASLAPMLMSDSKIAAGRRVYGDCGRQPHEG